MGIVERLALFSWKRGEWRWGNKASEWCCKWGGHGNYEHGQLDGWELVEGLWEGLCLSNWKACGRGKAVGERAWRLSNCQAANDGDSGSLGDSTPPPLLESTPWPLACRVLTLLMLPLIRFITRGLICVVYVKRDFRGQLKGNFHLFSWT